MLAESFEGKKNPLLSLTDSDEGKWKLNMISQYSIMKTSSLTVISLISTLPVAKVVRCLSLLRNCFIISQPLQTGANNLHSPPCPWKVYLPYITCLSSHVENTIKMISVCRWKRKFPCFISLLILMLGQIQTNLYSYTTSMCFKISLEFCSCLFKFHIFTS